MIRIDLYKRVLYQINFFVLPRHPWSLKVNALLHAVRGVLTFRGVRGVSDGKRQFTTDITLVIAAVIFITSCNTADRKSETMSGWNTYRHNYMRTAVTPEILPSSLALKWVHKSPHTPSPVWDLPAEELKRMHSDDTYHVSTADGLAYYGSSVDNKVYALDVATGKVKWVFYTEGPVRFSPTGIIACYKKTLSETGSDHVGLQRT